MYTPPFTINDKILGLVSEISEQIGALNVMLGNSMPSPMLRKENQIKTIHSSLAIEHNSLSLQQVTDVIEGKHVLGAPNEIQEVKNALQAYQLMQSLDAYEEKDLLRAHGLMMTDLVNKAGQYRTEGVGMFDGEKCIHVAPPADRVPSLMAELFEWMRNTDAHPLISSCVFHYEFEFIHPFLDGNGRMGRYWQTMILARWKSIFAWLPVETIVKQNQQEYYNAIAQSDAQGNSTVFIDFMLRCILQAIQEQQKTTNNVGVNVGVNEQRVLDLLAADLSLTAARIAEQLGISTRQAERLLAALKQKNLIRRKGADRNGHWEIIK
ncbi:MAG: Fic family protein [Paludibacteraceae bacterium]|nr:Fic family protein [Paludibacteraceae bacterium]